MALLSKYFLGVITVIKAIPGNAAGLIVSNKRMPKYVANGDEFKILNAQDMGGLS